MQVIYIAVLIFIMITYAGTFNYKKKYRKTLRNSKLDFLYGMSMFIFDMLKKLNIAGRRSHENDSLRKIMVKDIIIQEEYLYMVNKTALCILVFFIVIFAGTVYDFTGGDESKYEKTLLRPDNGSNVKTYNLDVIEENSDEREKVTIKISKVRHKDEYVYGLFEKYRDKVIERMLNGNSDADNICRDLKFDSEYGDEQISLSWGCRDNDIIDYGGKLSAESSGKETVIYLTMSFEGRSREYEIPIKITSAGEESFQEKIQKIVDESDAYNNEVTLPDEIDGKKVLFSISSRNKTIPFILIGIMAAAAVCAAKGGEVKNEVKKRNRQMEMDYSDIVSKLMLLSGAGLSIRMSWKRIVADYEKHVKPYGMRYAYEEMKFAQNKMDSGNPETETYAEFGRRCGLRSYIKLGSILEQNISKGSSGMKKSLEYEVREAFEERKNLAKKKGEEAGTKMLFPMLIMLVVSIIMVLIPSFMNMGI